MTQNIKVLKDSAKEIGLEINEKKKLNPTNKRNTETRRHMWPRSNRPNKISWNKARRHRKKHLQRGESIIGK